MNKIKQILEELWLGGNNSPRGIEGVEFRDRDILTALAQIKSEMMECVPPKRQVRYENIKREMDLDGVIINREQSIKYSKENVAYNQAITETKARLDKLFTKEEV